LVREIGVWNASVLTGSKKYPNFPDPFQTPNLGYFLGFQTSNLGYVLGFQAPNLGYGLGGQKGIEDQQKLPAKWYV